MLLCVPKSSPIGTERPGANARTATGIGGLEKEGKTKKTELKEGKPSPEVASSPRRSRSRSQVKKSSQEGQEGGQGKKEEEESSQEGQERRSSPRGQVQKNGVKSRGLDEQGGQV
jgi:hypothetical protein